LVPHTVGPDRLVKANAVMQGAFVLGNLAGPAVGGALTGIWGTRAPLELDAVSFLAIAGGIFLVRTRRRPAPELVAATRGRSGLRLVLGDSLLRAVIGSMTALILVSASVNVAEVFLFKDAFHASDAVFGITSACWMAGMIVGSALTARMGSGTAALLASMSLAELAVAAGLVIAGASPILVVAAAGFVLGGVGNGALTVASRTLVVIRVPDEFRGRVFGVMTGAINAASVLAYAAGGALVSALGPRPTIVGCGIAGLAVGLLFTVTARRARYGARMTLDVCTS
jgi:MFS family permease